MAPWQWLVLIIAVGGALLAFAVLADRRAHRRITGAGEPAPLRHNDEVNRHVPTYITQDEIDDLPAPGRGVSGSLPHKGEGFGFGHASPDFATVNDGATWANPRLLVVDGAVETMRELMTPLARASEESPLILIASRFHPDVLATLAANRRALGLPIVAATAGDKDRRRLAEATGATELTPADLQAGYVPDEALGRAASWSSTGSRCWVQPDQSAWGVEP